MSGGSTPHGGTSPGADWSPHMDRRGIVPHRQFMNALIRKGFSPEDAAAITGNVIHESGGNQLPGHPVILNPATEGSGGRGANHSGNAAEGAAQWEGKRKRSLANPSIEAQVQHIWDEMHGPERAAYEAMQRAKTVSEKAHIVNTTYERPKVPRASDRARRAYAEEAYRNRDHSAEPGAVAQTVATPSVAALSLPRRQAMQAPRQRLMARPRCQRQLRGA
jgi:Phage tail lysozyme